MLKQLYNLSDESVVAQWQMNTYYQLFCGETSFQNQITCHSTELVKCRQRIGKDVVLHLTKTGTGSGADVYLEFTLKNDLISDYVLHGSEHDTARPHEEITISFVDVEVKYIPYDEDGKALAPIAVAFDTATNTKR